MLVAIYEEGIIIEIRNVDAVKCANTEIKHSFKRKYLGCTQEFVGVLIFVIALNNECTYFRPATSIRCRIVLE